MQKLKLPATCLLKSLATNKMYVAFSEAACNNMVVKPLAIWKKPHMSYSLKPPATTKNTMSWSLNRLLYWKKKCMSYSLKLLATTQKILVSYSLKPLATTQKILVSYSLKPLATKHNLTKGSEKQPPSLNWISGYSKRKNGFHYASPRCFRRKMCCNPS